jgi:ferrous iron transport protein A
MNTFPLGMANEGETVKVIAVKAGNFLIKRLIAMGIVEETELKILQREQGNGLIVSRGETRLALGFGMANKIMVAPNGN